MKSIATAALALSLLATSAVQAQSDRNCGPRDEIIEVLRTKYGETRQSIGLGTGNQVVEVFASLETGTWTITATTPTGVTCLVSSGQSFEKLKEPKGEVL